MAGHGVLHPCSSLTAMSCMWRFSRCHSSTLAAMPSPQHLTIAARRSPPVQHTSACQKPSSLLLHPYATPQPGSHHGQPRALAGAGDLEDDELQEDELMQEELSSSGQPSSPQGTVVSGPACAAQAMPSESPGLFRFWHDDKRFKGSWFLAEQVLLAAGGTRTGGNVKSAPTNGRMGWQALDDWDLLWSPSTTASKAAGVGLSPKQVVSAVPGSRCLTRKKSLARTLHQKYGKQAFSTITPLTFELPTQMGDWLKHIQQDQAAARAAVAAAAAAQAQPVVAAAQVQAAGTVTQAQPAAAAAGSGWVAPSSSQSTGPMWILKTAQHLGKGMVICPQREAVRETVMRQQAVMKATVMEKKQLKPFVVAQRYVPDPLLINGRKFGLRLWAVITSVDPLRVYVHGGKGLVLFSSHEYKPQDTSDLQSHLTNYAQNVDGDVWSLDQFREHMGGTQYDKLHQAILKNTALTIAAGASHMRQECSRLRTPPGSVFELFGLDFLVDTSLRPWLLEVNATPSLAVEHALPDVERMIYDQKQVMLHDLFNLINVPGRFTRAHAGDDRSDGRAAADSHLELDQLGGWQPLMALMPDDQRVPLRTR